MTILIKKTDLNLTKISDRQIIPEINHLDEINIFKKNITILGIDLQDVKKIIILKKNNIRNNLTSIFQIMINKERNH